MSEEKKFLLEVTNADRITELETTINLIKETMIKPNSDSIEELEKKVEERGENYKIYNTYAEMNERIEKLEKNLLNYCETKGESDAEIDILKQELSELKVHQDNLWEVKENQIKELRESRDILLRYKEDNLNVMTLMNTEIKSLKEHEEQLREIVRKWNQEILDNRRMIHELKESLEATDIRADMHENKGYKLEVVLREVIAVFEAEFMVDLQDILDRLGGEKSVPTTQNGKRENYVPDSDSKPPRCGICGGDVHITIEDKLHQAEYSNPSEQDLTADVLKWDADLGDNPFKEKEPTDDFPPLHLKGYTTVSITYDFDRFKIVEKQDLEFLFYNCTPTLAKELGRFDEIQKKYLREKE